MGISARSRAIFTEAKNWLPSPHCFWIWAGVMHAMLSSTSCKGEIQVLERGSSLSEDTR